MPRASAPGGAQSTALVGRDRELAVIGACFDAVSEGLAVLGIVGEAGIGKSRLWQAAVAEARARGYAVLACRPNETDIDLPYTGLDDLLRSVPADLLDTLAPPRRHALDVALLKSEPHGTPLQQRAVGLATLDVIRELVATTPVVVAVDDAHWLDRPSHIVLRFALSRLAQVPVAVVVAVRSDRLSDGVLGLDRVVVEDRGSLLEVGPLSPAMIATIVADRYGLQLARSERAALHRQSGGNPLFALEIAGALRRGSAPAALGAFLPIPENLRDLLSDRLFHLPGPVRDLLGVVAAMSRPTVALAEAALDMPGGIDHLLDRAVAAGVLEVDTERLSFTHPLLRTVLYTDMTVEQRRRLHKRLSEVSTEVEERARHQALAADGPNAVVARALAEAATRARTRGAPDTAAELAEQAVRFTPSNSVDARLERALLAADSLLEAGDTVRARRLLEDVLPGTPPGGARATVSLALGRVRSYDGGHAASAELLERALEGAVGDDVLTARIERDLSTALVQTVDVRRALPHARAALSAAERVGSAQLLVPALAAVAMAEFLVGHGLRHDLMDRATALEAGLPRVPYEPGFLPVDLMWGGLLKWADDFDGARARFAAVRRRAERLAEESTWGSLLFQEGELELWAGHLVAAERCAAEIDEVTERSGQTAQRSHAAYLRAAVAAHRGELGPAHSAAGVALVEADRACDRRFRLRALALLGFTDLSDGRPVDALIHLEQADREHAGAGYGDPGVVRYQLDLVEALVAEGRFDRAAQVLARLEGLGRTLRRPRVLGLTARGRGLLLGAEGRVQEAEALLQQSVDQLETLPHPLELGRSLLTLGVVQRRSKQKRAARETLHRAASIFDDLGARSFAAKARAEAARIGGRAASAGLSTTEARIAELVGSGLTNADVAQTMFMSIKTVENTLTRVYRKLGVRSRRDLVRLHRLGQATPPEG